MIYIVNNSFTSKEIEALRGFASYLLENSKKGYVREEGPPYSIFIEELTPLQSIVKYLREELFYPYKRISDLLKKSTSSLRVIYGQSKKKFPGRLDVTSKDVIPFSVLKKKGSVFEHIVVYLKDVRKLSFKEISDLLKRDYQTIWTIYKKSKT